MDEEPRQTKGQDGSSTKAKPQKDNGTSVSDTPRKRVSQACDRCRSRKDKCDGKKPVCSTCAALEQVCSYDPAGGRATRVGACHESKTLALPLIALAWAKGVGGTRSFEWWLTP
jgi:hypothetical protein